MKKKALAKELDRCKRKLDAAAAQNKVLRKEIKRLNKEVSPRDRMVVGPDAAGKRGRAAIYADPLEILQGQARKGVASAHRKAWVRHEYLRDRYEFHLQHGLEKHDARISANFDLIEEYGADEGYSEEKLRDILS